MMIDYLYILLIALPVGLVAFNAGFWGGIYRCLCVSEAVLTTVVFMFSQAGLFWLGSWSGNSFAHSIGWMSVPFAEAIILLTGVKLIYGALRVRPEQKSYDLSKFGELIAVSFASGLNAFMTGLGYGLLREASVDAIVAIIIATAVLGMAGIYLGKHRGRFFYATFAGVFAGFLLIALGTLLALDLYGVI